MAESESEEAGKRGDLYGSTGIPDPRAEKAEQAMPDRQLMFRRVKSQLFGSGPANEPVRIGRFVVIKRIGQGGMGLIYSAYDDSLDRKVAVKLLRPERAGVGSDGQVRLMREAQALARLSHPNVIHVYEVGTYEDQVYVAMEYVDGETLESWQKNRDWREILGRYIEAARGLAAAHTAGIVHRDFKAENVLVGADDRTARVLDFGLARTEFEPGDTEVEELRDLAEQDVDVPLTHTGVIMGTPAYMAPEQHAGKSTDPRTDQFSFCVSLWEALYGFRPFAGSTLVELRMNVQDGAVEPAPRFTDVPPRIHKALLRGVSTMPADRYPTLDALLADLTEPPPPTRLPLVAAAGAVLAIAAAGGIWWSAAADKEVAAEGLRLRAEFERARVVEAEEELRRLRSRSVSEKWNEVVLSYAQGNLRDYPTESLAALKHLVVEADGWLDAARTVAADATRRGPIARELRGVGAVGELRFDPSGQEVAILTDGGRIVRWNVESGNYEPVPPLTAIKERPKRDDPVVFTHIAFDPTGRLLATEAAGELYRWSADDTVDIAYLGELRLTALASSPNGNIALGESNGTVRVVDRTSFESLHVLRNHEQPVRSLDFSPDGSMLASASDDGTVKLWSLVEGTHRTLQASPTAVHCRFLEDGALVAGVTSANRLHVWATSDGRAIPNREANARSFDAAASRALFVLDHPEVGLSVRYPEDITPRPLDHHGTDPTAIAVAPTGRWAVAATESSLQAWRIGEDERGMRPGGEVPFLAKNAKEGSVRTMEFAAGGELVWGSGRGIVRRWDVDGTSTKLLDLDGRVMDIAIDPSGTRVAVDDDSGLVQVVPLAGGDALALPLAELPLPGSLHWNPQGTMVAKLGCAGAVTCFVDLLHADGTEGSRLAVAAGSRDLRFSPDGETLVVEGDGGVTLWPGGEDSVEVSWPVDPAPVFRVALAHTPDGSLRIATTDRNSTGATSIRLDVWQIGARPDRVHALFSEPDLKMVVPSEDRQSLLLTTAEGRNLLWSLEEDRFRMLPDAIGSISRMLISPNRRSILLVGPDSAEARVLDVESGHTRTLPPVFGIVAWSPLGAIAVAGRGARQWIDPTPDDPQNFLKWLDQATTVELESESIRTRKMQRSDPDGR